MGHMFEINRFKLGPRGIKIVGIDDSGKYDYELLEQPQSDEDAKNPYTKPDNLILDNEWSKAANSWSEAWEKSKEK